MNDQNQNQESDELDRLLSAWHDENQDAARAGRDRMLEAVAAENPSVVGRIDADSARTRSPGRFSSLIPGRGMLAAALFIVVAMLSVLLIPDPQRSAFAQVIQVPEGGRLEAFDADGNTIGPCPLQNTDVSAEVSGPIVSVSIAQRYANPYDIPIEAVYTFPMSNRGAVHRMKMTVVDRDGNERIVEGEVKERELARRIYEQAKDAGYVASLLEQERPNIFTQSVANIAPGAAVTVEIGYLEVIEARDGEYAFEFPTVVGPRYIPGNPSPSSIADLPEGVAVRRGIILRGPGNIVPFAVADDWNDFLQRPVEGFDGLTFGAWMKQKIASTPDGVAPTEVETWTPGRVFELMTSAVRIDRPAIAGTIVDPRTDDMTVVVEGLVDYEPPANDGKTPDTASDYVIVEPFTLYDGGYGAIGDRWFCWAPPAEPQPGSNFAPDTDQVPDASRITPMPVRPDQRAGHDISIDVRIDTGGVPIVGLEAPLHEVVEKREGKGKVEVRLADLKTIPNRDFVLRWRLEDDAITESVFTHVIPGNENEVVPGGYLTMVLSPPESTPAEEVRPRELVFVLDTSGSMRGFPIEKAKAVMTRAIDSMRENDTFNLITFAGSTRMLWDRPRPATEENRALANDFIESRQGGGGTEMMKAINAALTRNDVEVVRLTVDELKNLPADGREVRIRMPFGSFAIRQLVAHPDQGKHNDGIVSNREDMDIKYAKPMPDRPAGIEGMRINGDTLVDLDGRWVTRDGRRIMDVDTATFVIDDTAWTDDGTPVTDVKPMRIVVFMTDGYVGNDQAIIQAIRDNAKSTRVFALGVGNSVNRFLLDEMARQGRGAVDYVLLADGADEVVDRLSSRIQTPVLTDIEVKIEGVESYDILPTNPAGLLPDLFDARPIMLHARYRPPTSGSVEGTVVISGNTGSGPYQRRIPVTFSNEAPEHASIATLWARARVDEVLAPHLLAVEQQLTPPKVKAEVISLGEGYSIVTPFTSFVAVEKSKVVVEGRSMLVTVPIELPDGIDWEGIFGDDCPFEVREKAMELAGIEPVKDVEELIRVQDDAMPDAAVTRPPTGSSVKREAGDGKRRFRGNAPAGGAAGRSPGSVAAPPLPDRKSSRSASNSSVRSDGASRGRSRGGSGQGFGGGGGRGAGSTRVEGDIFGAGAELEADSDSMAEIAVDEEAVVGSAFDEVASQPVRDFNRIARTIDRRLLMLFLGTKASDIKGIPVRGLDGRPWIDGSTIEVTILLEKDASLSPEVIKDLGISIEGRSMVGGATLIVARIDLNRILDLGETTGIRRVVPTTGS
ncbi:MAG: hypothetical protein CMJ67_07350 [Planctomycetaceae bacterium]|nr:hypothetical protein [Planctomycetaceae bacterium]